MAQRVTRRSGRPAVRGATSQPAVELVLYVSAASPYAQRAVRNCEALLARFDRNRVAFEVCDVSRHPARAEEDSVCYTPVLVKKRPLPRTYIVGDLSNPSDVVTVLESCGVGLAR